MEPLPNAVSLPAPFPTEEHSLDPPIVGLLPCEFPSATEVDPLDAPHPVERHAKESHRIARRMDPVEGIFVRVQGDRTTGLIRRRSLLPHDDDDLSRDNGEGPQAP